VNHSYRYVRYFAYTFYIPSLLGKEVYRVGDIPPSLVIRTAPASNKKDAPPVSTMKPRVDALNIASSRPAKAGYEEFLATCGRAVPPGGEVLKGGLEYQRIPRMKQQKKHKPLLLSRRFESA